MPVALKAAMVNNPPAGIEGRLYAEIGRTKPAPQGICTLNSDGNVLAWALSFDSDGSVLKFLDHVSGRYWETLGGDAPVMAERFRKFPGWKLPDVPNQRQGAPLPAGHGQDRCPAMPAVQQGTLVGRIIGRPLDSDGKPIAQTLRQEDYMEARFEVSVDAQQQLADATTRANGRRFPVPHDFARSVVSHAYLGQLDVHPLGDVPGSRNESQTIDFVARAVASNDPNLIRIHLRGSSDVAGSQNRSPDRRLWEHRVTLKWQGYVDIRNDRVVQLVCIANGDEQLRWGNANLRQTRESDVEHLMAGHAIDLQSAVRYGLIAKPAPADEVADASRLGERPSAALQAKVKRIQAGLQRLQLTGGDPSRITDALKEFEQSMRARKFQEAERPLDILLELPELRAPEKSPKR